METAVKKNTSVSAKRKKCNCLDFNNFYGYFLMIIPAAIFFAVFFALPVISSLYFSFTNFDGLNLKHDFVGLRNFNILFFKEPAFFHSVFNSFVFAAAVTILQNFMGLMVALVVNKPLKTSHLQRTILFMPCLISSVVVAFLWTYIYDVNGILNIVLKEAGLGSLSRPWLGSINTALAAIIIAHVWRFIGRSSILYLANLKTMSQDVLEAATIDGAAGFNRFRHVIFPLLAPATTVNILSAFTGSLNTFDIVFAMTNGGPGYSTETMATFVVKQMLDNYNGYASAASIVMIIIILLVNIFVFRFLASREESIW